MSKESHSASSGLQFVGHIGGAPNPTVDPLGTYANNPVTGAVIAHFKTSGEFDGDQVFYQKQGPWVFVQRGGIRYDLSGLLPGFQPSNVIHRKIARGCNSEFDSVH